MSNENGCKCQRCGITFKVDFNIDDELWQQITLNKYNLLCGMCITLLIEGLNQFDYFDIVKMDLYNV